jgi:hypothetical protein
MANLTPEQIREREELTNKIVNEILNEEGIEELQGLLLYPREKLPNIPYWESDTDFLSRGHNHRAASILLSAKPWPRNQSMSWPWIMFS